MVRIRIGDEEQELDWDEWERRVRQGRIPPTTQVAIEAITGGDFVEARTLESYHSLRDDAALAWQGHFNTGPAPLMTALIVGLNIRLWWLARVPEGYRAFDVNFTNWAAPTFEDGEPYRLLTMGVLHLTLPHLAMNMLWLGYTGWNLERALGRVNLLAIYVASVLGGSVLSMIFSPESRSLGASGGVFGLVAAAVVFGFVRPELLPSRGRRVFGLALLPYLVVMFASGLTNEGIDNWSHFGGLLTGAVAVLLLDPTPLQRRPRWNVMMWSVGGALATALMVVLMALGPRIAPIEDVDVARERIQQLSMLPRADAPDLAPYRTVLWSVPAGWRYGVTASGESGFASPSPRGDRVFAVREDDHAAPVDAAGRALAWSAKVRAAMPDAELSRPEAAELGGLPGLTLRARTPGGVALQWWGVTRGVYTLEAVWHVDARSERRLAPLARRLHRSVAWREPEVLTQALITRERNPASRRAQAELARAYATLGRPEDAEPLYRALLDVEPTNPDWLAGMLKLAAWYPHIVPDPDVLRDQALANDPSAALILVVVDSLEEQDEADAVRGLLGLAWERLPGDRTLRRTLRRRAIPTDLDPETNRPRALTHDPETGARRDPAVIEARLARPLTLAAARDEGARVRALRAAWAGRVRAAVDATRPLDAIEPLLLLKHEAPPADRDEALATLTEDLRTLDVRGSLRWLPAELSEPVRASGLLERVAGPSDDPR